MKNMLLAAVLSALLLGCSSRGIDHADINQFVEVIYAEVVKTKPVEFKSEVGKAAATGAIEGAIESTWDDDNIVGGAIAGAIAGALFISIEEGSRQGLLVNLRATDLSHQNIVTKRTDIQVGDCLQLIKGNEVSIMKVTTNYCRIPEAVAAE